MNNSIIVKSAFTIALLFLISVLFIGFTKKEEKKIVIPKIQNRVWQIKSIDTMKYSRDLAGEKLNDPTFDQTINRQVKAISQTGATHVALGTPYDDRFVPFLNRWVQAARRNNLKVWFRGNFSGWEGWFGYRRDLTREEHLALMREFINQNGHLFENGDVFSPCPECENGGPGDPRRTGDVAGFRKFLVDEHQAASEQFRKIGKNVRIVGSMNYDVAELVMDEDTANAVGNLIVIDHYVKTPQKLADDIDKLAKKSNAQIILGEFGVPIPDIHGALTPQTQADWIEEALKLVSKDKNVIGLNYWVAVGGSTAIFNDDLSPRPAANIIKGYFSLSHLNN